MLQLIILAYILTQLPSVPLWTWAVWFFALFLKIISFGITVGKSANKY